MKAVVKKSQRPMYEENTEQVKIGIEVLSLLRFLSHAGSDTIYRQFDCIETKGVQR